jgi:hypothetical protein
MKQKPFASFLFELLALSVILYGLLWIIFQKLLDMPEIRFEFMLIVLFIVTALSYWLVVNSTKKDYRTFTYSYIGSSTGRLILYSVFLFAYCFNHRDTAKVFILTFFVLYIIYTVFEVRKVQKFIKPQ